jgi:hypothetical protein
MFMNLLNWHLTETISIVRHWNIKSLLSGSVSGFYGLWVMDVASLGWSELIPRVQPIASYDDIACQKQGSTNFEVEILLYISKVP